MQYQPLTRRVIIKDAPVERKNDSGIILLEKPHYKRAIVISVSTDVTEVKSEDIVFYEGEGFPMQDGKNEYKIVKPEQIAYFCIPCSAK